MLNNRVLGSSCIVQTLRSSWATSSSTAASWRYCSKRGVVGFQGSLSGTLQKVGPVLGATLECSHTFCQEDVNTFAKICGDTNPLHTNVEIASKSMFKGTIVHGILVSSLFSTLLGASMHGAVYVSQDLSFKKPVHVGARVTAKLEVLQKDQKRTGHLLTCRTAVLLEDGSTAVEGTARCMLPYSQYPRD
jgi:3-hydroxybutyryl-CoA dehydratase